MTHLLLSALISILFVFVLSTACIADNNDIKVLSITSIDIQPVSAPNSPISGTITVVNPGNITSMSRDVNIYLSDDDNITSEDYKVGTVSLSFLRPGEVAERGFFLTTPSSIQPGNYTAGAMLGPGFKLASNSGIENSTVTGGFVDIQPTYLRPLDWFDKKIADQIFVDSNNERTLRGLKPLVRDENLDEIAEEHSRDMAERDFFDHKNPDGESPVDRAARHGYPQNKTLSDGTTISGIGENIVKIPATEHVYAYGTISADDPYQIGDVAVESFMESKSHREALLLPLFEKIGIGMAFDGTNYYATQNFF